MSAFQIKLLACLFMLIDHIGYILFPQYIVFRIIGRLAFPIFAWFIALGYNYTKSVANYMLRLFFLAILYQIPLVIVKDIGDFRLNIFFTLFLGLLSIYVYEKEKTVEFRVVKVILIGIVAELIKADYGMYGIATIVLFHVFSKDWLNIIKSQLLLNVAYVLSINMCLYFFNGAVSKFVIIQMCSVLSLNLIYLYNFKQGRKMKLFFYSFYPIHLIVLYLIRVVVK